MVVHFQPTKVEAVAEYNVEDIGARHVLEAAKKDDKIKDCHHGHEMHHRMPLVGIHDMLSLFKVVEPNDGSNLCKDESRVQRIYKLVLVVRKSNQRDGHSIGGEVALVYQLDLWGLVLAQMGELKDNEAHLQENEPLSHHFVHGLLNVLQLGLLVIFIDIHLDT